MGIHLPIFSRMFPGHRHKAVSMMLSKILYVVALRFPKPCTVKRPQTQSTSFYFCVKLSRRRRHNHSLMTHANAVWRPWMEIFMCMNVCAYLYRLMLVSGVGRGGVKTCCLSRAEITANLIDWSTSAPPLTFRCNEEMQEIRSECH